MISLRKRFCLFICLVFISTLFLGCSKPEDKAASTGDEFMESMPADMEPWFGDLDGMVERRRIRALVAYSQSFYFVDGGQQRGVAYDTFKKLEDEINKKLKKKTIQVHVIFIPVSRDALIPALLEGRGDIAAANLTITPGRLEKVDFSDPLITDVSEILVTEPGVPPIESLDDLAGKEVYVRTSSSYYESLQRLNKSFKEKGKKPVKIIPADEHLESEDILEMVNAGIIKMTVIDSHIGEFWSKIFEKITLHHDIAVNTGGKIAWAFRKNSPELKKVVDEFVRKNKKGTFFGNMMLNRYLKSTKWVKNSTAENEIKKFEIMIDLFKKYAGKYDFDWLLVAAQAYQESGLDQSKKSHAGAIGVMQLLPSTAKDPNVNIKAIEKLENNIHAGIKYLRFIRDRYFENEDMDSLNKTLFSFASYNAGPARVAQLRKKAAEKGLDPNEWFDNVELIAAREIGRETVQYVSNIYKYYIAYTQVVKQLGKKKQA
jgi:membrane-bound lytic murein transglycosylase MltF